MNTTDKYALLDLDKLRELTGNQFRDLDAQNAVNVLHRKGLISWRPEFCCEHSWNHAKQLAWKERDTNCGCDHNESCKKCWPLDFRHGGKWAAYCPTPPQDLQQAPDPCG